MKPLDREMWWPLAQVLALDEVGREERRQIEHAQARGECDDLTDRAAALATPPHDAKRSRDLLRVMRALSEAAKRAADTESMRSWLRAKQQGRL